MSATEFAALVVVVLVVAVTLASFVVLQRLSRTVTELQASVERFVRESEPVLDELRDVVGTTSTELERADTLLDTAQSISGTVDSASRLAYGSLSKPVIKTMAFASGTAHVARRLRQRGS